MARQKSVLKSTIPTWIATCDACTWHKTCCTANEALKALVEHLDLHHGGKWDERDHLIYYSDKWAKMVVEPRLTFDSLRGNP